MCNLLCSVCRSHTQSSFILYLYVAFTKLYSSVKYGAVCNTFLASAVGNLEEESSSKKGSSQKDQQQQDRRIDIQPAEDEEGIVYKISFLYVW